PETVRSPGSSSVANVRQHGPPQSPLNLPQILPFAAKRRPPSGAAFESDRIRSPPSAPSRQLSPNVQPNLSPAPAEFAEALPLSPLPSSSAWTSALPLHFAVAPLPPDPVAARRFRLLLRSTPPRPIPPLRFLPSHWLLSLRLPPEIPRPKIPQQAPRNPAPHNTP